MNINFLQVIESKMEQFKVCEKDTKSKMPKDGSMREYREDPKEAERDEKRTWLQESVERLENIIQTINVEVEKVANSKGKTKNKEQVKYFIKTTFHISLGKIVEI
jgi:CCR4-NOT transcription complex subunit 3